MSNTTFNFNIAFTQAVNTPDQDVILTPTELWYGIRRGGRHPDDFAEYVASCEVVSGGKTEFQRKLTLANGAVHTAAGEHLIQDVLIAENLHVSHTVHSLVVKRVGVHSIPVCNGVSALTVPVCGSRAKSGQVLATGIQRIENLITNRVE